MAKVKHLFKNEPIIDDSNFQALVGDGSSVTFNGQTYYLSAKPPRSKPKFQFPSFGSTGLKLIPRSEWQSRIEEQIVKKRRVSDFIDFPAYNQSSTNYCWANGPCQAASTSRRIQGLPYIQFSAASIAAPIKSYRNQGGWGEDACNYLEQHGACSVKTWPNAAISRSYDTPESRKERELFKVLSWLQCPSNMMFDYVASACLQTRPGAPAYDWWRHLVMSCDLVLIEANSYGLRIRNSWGESYGVKNALGYGGFAVFREGKGTPSECEIVDQVTQSA